uniref:Uncharacterized protein n=1 Tax=Glossina palpalis gambiensis TaxID=67801 RepID=A0A1B0B042_9MUSC
MITTGHMTLATIQKNNGFEAVVELNEGIVRDEDPLSFTVKGELPGVMLWEVIGYCCDLKFGASSRCLSLINERREVDGSLSTLGARLFVEAPSEYFKDSKSKTSCFKCEAPSTKAAKRQGSRNLVIIC